MGGYGSGSRHRYAPKTYEYQKIDMSDFKNCWFEHNNAGTLRWSRGDRETGSVGFCLTPRTLRLHYSLTRQGQREAVDEYISFDFTCQHFGGDRRWFLCRSCNRRCRVLYGGAYFRCRQCYGATYESQYQHWRFPNLSSAERARQKLGAEPGFCNPLPRKPKGMHWLTYRKLEEQDWQAVTAIERALNGWGSQ